MYHNFQYENSERRPKRENNQQYFVEQLQRLYDKNIQAFEHKVDQLPHSSDQPFDDRDDNSAEQEIIDDDADSQSDKNIRPHLAVVAGVQHPKND